jgi:glucosamine 6-phosphate synthetase-like amidotransferase/phosphosugar isomerase protein
VQPVRRTAAADGKAFLVAAMQIAKERGARVVAVTNIMGSAIARAADGVLYTRAGLEIGVAASKTFHMGKASCSLVEE